MQMGVQMNAVPDGSRDVRLVLDMAELSVDFGADVHEMIVDERETAARQIAGGHVEFSPAQTVRRAFLELEVQTRFPRVAFMHAILMATLRLMLTAKRVEHVLYGVYVKKQ